MAKLIAPCVLFSEDRHLRKPGLAPPAWRAAAQFAVNLAGGVTGQRITGNLATLPFRGGAELVAFLSRKTGISPWIMGGITAAGAAYVLASPQRRQAVGKYVMPVAEALVKETERSAALEQDAIANLREILLTALPEPNVKQQTAIVLVGTRADLTDVFALHAEGRTKVIHETRPRAHVNEAIAEVLHGKAKARLVLQP